MHPFDLIVRKLLSEGWTYRDLVQEVKESSVRVGRRMSKNDLQTAVLLGVSIPTLGNMRRKHGKFADKEGAGQ